MVKAGQRPALPGCDGIVALELFGPAGVPTVSEWGMVAMTLLLLSAGTLVYARRGPVRHAA